MPFHELIIDSSNPATYAAYGSPDLPKIGNKRTYVKSQNDEYLRKMLLQRGTKMTVTKVNDSGKYKSDKPISQSTPKESAKVAKRPQISGSASKESSKSLALKVGRELSLSLTPKDNSQSSAKKSSPYLNEYLKSLQKNSKTKKDVEVRKKNHLDAMKNNLAKAPKQLSNSSKSSQKEKFEAPKYVEKKTKTLPERKKTLPSRLQAGDIYYVDYVPYVDMETDSSLSNYEASDMSSEESYADEDF